MYERFFQLRERPFALSPDPDYLYPSRVHREALAYLRYGIESQAGFVVITGEIGSGKTTLVQALLRGLDGQTTVVRLMNTLLDPRELLEAITLDLGVAVQSASKPVLLQALAQRLIEERRAGRLVLLVIDEAQNLDRASLEELRMLSNLETEKSKLVQLILVGQPNLRDTLNQPSLEQLRQRITVSYHLTPLDREETAAYVNHRLRRAAVGPPIQLTREVTDRVHERSGGVPRLINVIADAVLVLAYAEERRTFDRVLVDEALAELEATGVLQPLAADERRAGASEPPAERPLDQDLRDKEADLRLREEQVARAEQLLSEQRRVLSAEYQLFNERGRHTPGPEAAASATTSWPPLAASTAPRNPADDVLVREEPRPPVPPRGQVVRFNTAPWVEEPPRRTFWRRMRNLIRGTA